MGANFAPSYANLMMGLWEQHSTWNNNPYSEHIVFFGRYVDDIVIIWDGTRSRVDYFVAYCNTNDLGLSFTSVCDPNTLAFLDLELSHSDEHIHAKNYTKPTVGNSNLHFHSCHHPR